jgi:hypothetical protein
MEGFHLGLFQAESPASVSWWGYVGFPVGPCTAVLSGLLSKVMLQLTAFMPWHVAPSCARFAKSRECSIYLSWWLMYSMSLTLSKQYSGLSKMHLDVWCLRYACLAAGRTALAAVVVSCLICLPAGHKELWMGCLICLPAGHKELWAFSKALICLQAGPGGL